MKQRLFSKRFLSLLLSLCLLVSLAPAVTLTAKTWAVLYVAELCNAFGESQSPYGTVQEAINDAAAGDIVKLIANTNEYITVGSSKDITLDLNGYVLNAAENGGHHVIDNQGTLTIIDSNKDNQIHYFDEQANGLWLWNGDTEVTDLYCAGGLITGGSNSQGGGIGNYNATAKLTIEAGNIIGNTSRWGGGINNKDGGVTTIQGGTICGNVACFETYKGGGGGIYSNSTLILQGGTITDNLSPSGGGVLYDASTMQLGGDVIITGNTLMDGTTASNLGIAMNNTNKITFNDVSEDMLIGISLYENSTGAFRTPKDTGVFTSACDNNYTANFFPDADDAAVRYNDQDYLEIVEHKTHNMVYWAQGNTIYAKCIAEDCHCRFSDGDELSFYCRDNFDYDGYWYYPWFSKAYPNNKAVDSTTGEANPISIGTTEVCWYDVNFYNGNVELDGVPWLPGSYRAELTVEGATAVYWFTIKDTDTEAQNTHASDTDETIAALEKGAIINHKTGKKATHSGNAYYYNEKNKKCSAKWTKLTQAVLEKSKYCLGTDGTVTVYYLTEDLDLAQVITIEGTVHICLNGKSITASAEDSAFHIYENATLYLYNCTGGGCVNGTSGHYDDKLDGWCGGAVYNEGNFVLYGGVFSECEAEYGGAVYNTGIFLMENGTISECVADFGGGVYNCADGANASFVMKGGAINYCDANISGGGIYNDVLCGDVLYGNKISTYAYCTLNGGSVKECWAKYSGGGVYNDGDLLTLNGGSIIDCEAYWGAGVYNCDEFILKSGSITGCATIYNEEENFGGWAGGVYNEYLFTMNGGTIADCTAQWSGGAVVNYDGSIGKAAATFTLNGGTIENCEACYGGGIYNEWDVWNGYASYNTPAKVILNGGKIQNCNAVEYVYDNGDWYNAWGGGIYNQNAVVEGKTTITGCTSEDYAGGIYSLATTNFAAQLNLKNTVISSCEACYGGGGIHNEYDFYSADRANGKAQVNLDNVTIQNCRATDGGAIYNDFWIGCEDGCEDSSVLYDRHGLDIADYIPLNINNSTIKDCYASDIGGGIYSYGDMTMKNSTISACTAEIGAGGVVNCGEFHLSDSTITGCTVNVSAEDGGMWGGGILPFNCVYVSGLVKVVGNTVCGAANNVELAYNSDEYQCEIGFDGALTSGSRIGISKSTRFYDNITVPCNDNYVQFFTSDDPNYAVKYGVTDNGYYTESCYFLAKRSDTAFDSLTNAAAKGWQTLIFADEAGNLSDKSLDVYLTQKGSNWNYQITEGGLYLNIANGKLVKSAKCSVTWIYANGSLSAKSGGKTYYLTMGENGPELSLTKASCGILYSHIYGATKVIK